MSQDLTPTIKEALLKLGLQDEILYDSDGNIKPEYNLTPLELQALMYYLGTGAYRRKNKVVYDTEMAQFFTEEGSKIL